MKLLEDMPSVEVRRAPRRRSRITLAITIGILIAGALAGVAMLANSSDLGAPADSAAGAGDGEPVALATWVSGVTQACASVADAHPVLTEGAPARAEAANIAAVDAGTRALATAVRDLPAPTAEAESAQTTAAAALGDQADQAWYGLAAAPDDATGEQLTAAAGLTTSFVASLTTLGADCAAITP